MGSYSSFFIPQELLEIALVGFFVAAQLSRDKTDQTYPDEMLRVARDLARRVLSEKY